MTRLASQVGDRALNTERDLGEQRPSSWEESSLQGGPGVGVCSGSSSPSSAG